MGSQINEALDPFVVSFLSGGVRDDHGWSLGMGVRCERNQDVEEVWLGSRFVGPPVTWRFTPESWGVAVFFSSQNGGSVHPSSGQ